MDIREYRPGDLPAIHVINEAETPAVGAVSRAALGELAAMSTFALVAEVAGEVAGFGLVLEPGLDYGSSNYAWFGERYEHFVYLDRVAFAPQHQRRGFGRALYAAVERRTRTERPAATHFTLEVNVRPRNDPSLSFHAKLGFVELEQRETPYGARVSMMAKVL
ncbi:MAG: GNAT family N-acetyltransferase [Ilumatobacter sp.]|uniref:GNAT family N-acetyltransferase n=1 Tax=Ilumatobacter sp. TaxID=1967498 RepID=UPI00260F7E95|nr:GNAT family N-acetyltransferase [Ilumatobacter sp.]MDJ0770262.1 GNAT family N-acetyltransferase [Ilumatobacter sp.]